MRSISRLSMQEELPGGIQQKVRGICEEYGIEVFTYSPHDTERRNPLHFLGAAQCWLYMGDEEGKEWIDLSSGIVTLNGSLSTGPLSLNEYLEGQGKECWLVALTIGSLQAEEETELHVFHLFFYPFSSPKKGGETR